ncbi:MAG: TetR/AcrR family transcriptional regulator, transcriptional repressor for nem operon [Gemmatimonadales bacterium]|jgi:TetR/AcrR family transcriptional repressor of nem operon|nr:TetR/AcrR family transcriptional regulator, transcriptional repressor for nem operon [Gemmatimonadales bacterium]
MARSKSFDEDAVLDQAVQLFWERGYEGTSLADLEAHLGLGRQSLYNSFGDKHALFLKALDRYQRNMGGAACARLNAPDAGLDAIRGFFQWSVESQTSPNGGRGCFLGNTISELGAQDPDALLRCNHARDTLERGFRRALGQAKARREVPQSLDIEATATLLVIQNYGLAVLAKAGAPATQLNGAVEALLAGLK